MSFPVPYTADPNRPRTVSGADVSVEPRADRLVVVLPDGAVFDLLDVFSNALTNRVMERFTDADPPGDAASNDAVNNDGGDLVAAQALTGGGRS